MDRCDNNSEYARDIFAHNISTSPTH